MDTVRLYHGTTASRADAVLAQGWNPDPPEAIVESTCAEFGFELLEIQAAMVRDNQYATQTKRTGFVSFTTCSYRAANWAQRAPEVRYELLTSAWKLAHPEAGEFYTREPDYHRWIWAHLDLAPVVIEVELPVACLRPEDQSVDSEIWDRRPEVAVDLPVAEAEILGVEPVSRRVYPATGPALMGIEVESFIEAARSGDWGESVQPPRSDVHGAWWPWEEFCKRVRVI